jgi:hypothetical protein
MMDADRNSPGRPLTVGGIAIEYSKDRAARLVTNDRAGDAGRRRGSDGTEGR